MGQTSSIRVLSRREGSLQHWYRVTTPYRTRVYVTVTRSIDTLAEWVDVDIYEGTPARYSEHRSHTQITVGAPRSTLSAAGVRFVGFHLLFDPTTSRIGTLQLCLANDCLVFQLTDTSPCPPYLSRFLLDHNNVFIGTDMVNNVHLLSAQMHFEGYVRYLELGPILTLAKIVLMFGWMPAPWQVETDWGRSDYLSVNQAHFACLCAYFNLRLASHLNEAYN